MGKAQWFQNIHVLHFPAQVPVVYSWEQELSDILINVIDESHRSSFQSFRLMWLEMSMPGSSRRGSGPVNLA